jgi:phosphohistidine phosphatase
MPERTLILLRHAKSDWSGDEADIARPLAKRGRRQAPEAGRWLAANLDSVDLAVVSPADRARSTWALVAAELDAPPRTRIDDRVYAASDQQLLTVREPPDDIETVVLVGHNPGIEDLASFLTGESVPMPTSALAVITLPGSWSTAGRDSAVLRDLGQATCTLIARSRRHTVGYVSAPRSPVGVSLSSAMSRLRQAFGRCLVRRLSLHS